MTLKPLMLLVLVGLAGCYRARNGTTQERP